MTKFYMATDQYGNTYHALVHPRKELCERLGIKHVTKMYKDDNNGAVFQVGYVIGRYWLALFEVTPMRKSC